MDKQSKDWVKNLIGVFEKHTSERIIRIVGAIGIIISLIDKYETGLIFSSFTLMFGTVLRQFNLLIYNANKNIKEIIKQIIVFMLVLILCGSYYFYVKYVLF